MWDDAHMTDEEKAKEQAALERLDALTATFESTKEAHEQAREELQAAIVEILMDRQAAPGKVAAHSPYDRNHIRRIADAAGVPPLRERTVRSAKRAG